MSVHLTSIFLEICILLSYKVIIYTCNIFIYKYNYKNIIITKGIWEEGIATKPQLYLQ